MDSYESLVIQAVKGLKKLKGFRNHSDEAHSMNCTLAGRVMQVFGVGMTRAVRLCHLAELDPDFPCYGRRKTK